MNAKKFLKLRYLIQSAGYTFGQFADKLNMSLASLSNRLNGHSPWTVEEALLTCELLGIGTQDIGTLFKDCNRKEKNHG